MYLCKCLMEYGFPSNYSVTSKSNVFDFFLNLSTDSSGFLKKEKSFSKYFPELYQEYKSIVFPEESNDWGFCQKLWHFLQDDYELKLGICPICGKRCSFENKFRKNYHKYCSSHCQNIASEVIEKRFQTRIKNSGSIENSFKNALKKSFETRVKNSGSLKESYKNGIEKMKETNNVLYGCDYYTQTQEYKDRFEKIKDDKLKKEYTTKKLNKSFNSSKLESYICQYLNETNIEYIYQYKSDEYPFVCDYYFPTKKIYVEINGTWTHNNHPFNPDNNKDIETLNQWIEKSKNSKYYSNAIYVWTDLDVRKRNFAIHHNIKLVEIFSSDKNVCINKIINLLK